MQDVTHLSEDFDEQIAAITAQLRDKLTGHQYHTLHYYLADKDFAGATRHLRSITELWDHNLSCSRLILLRKNAKSQQDFYDRVDQAIDTYESFAAIMKAWNDLMKRNGGPKQVARLTKLRYGKLPVAAPPVFAPKMALPPRLV